MGGNFIGATGLDENQEQFDILQENIDANASYINNLVGIPDPTHTAIFGINILNPGLFGLVERAEVNIAALQTGEEGLTTQVEGIETQIAGIEGEITGIQGEIAGIQGEITGIQGEITGIQFTEIPALSGAISAVAGVAGDALGKANKSLGIWDEDGNNTYNMKSGNVGIGILPKGTLLNNKLEVAGSVNIPTGSKYKINNVDLSYNDLTNKLTQGTNISIVGNAINNTLPITTNVNDIYTTNTGNVGIGTSILNNKLEVAGSVNIPTGSKYKINNVDLSYNDLTNKLTAGDRITIANNVITAEAPYASEQYSGRIPIREYGSGVLNYPANFAFTLDGVTIKKSTLQLDVPNNVIYVPQPDWNQDIIGGSGYIYNKPTLFDGNYNSLTNKLTAGTNISIVNNAINNTLPITINANNIYTTNIGNVGIGTTILNNKLEIAGSVNIPTGSKYKINNIDLSYNDLTNKLTAGTNISIISGAINNTYSLPTASTTILGGVKVGNNLSIDGTGILSATAYTLPTASTTILGGVKVGNNLSIDGTGILSATAYTLPTASTTILGGVKVDGSTITINGSGVISGANTYTLPTASTTILGGVKVDGSTITINGSGVISSTSTASGASISLDGSTNNRSYGWTGSTSLLGRVGVAETYSTGSAVEDVVLRSQGKLILQSGITNPAMVIDTTNNAFFRNAVGIGTSTIAANNILDIGGVFRVGNNVPLYSFLVSNITGNVGMGTTAETNSKLHLHKAGASLIKIHFTDGFTGTAETNGLTIYKSSTDEGYFWNYQNKPLIFGTNNLERLRILENGNVGIGTTSPSSRLHLHNTLSNQNVSLQITDASTLLGGLILNKSTNNNGFLVNYENAALLFGTNLLERMRISADGNVGIGTTIPFSTPQRTMKLDVNGNVYAGNNSYFLSDHTGTSGSQFFGKQYTSTILAGMEIENTTLGGNYSQKLHFHTHTYGGGYGRRLTINENGNILTSGTLSLAGQLTLPSDQTAIFSGGRARTYYINNGPSIYWGNGTGNQHVFRNSANSDSVVINDASQLIVSNGVYQRSTYEALLYTDSGSMSLCFGNIGDGTNATYLKFGAYGSATFMESSNSRSIYFNTYTGTLANNLKQWQFSYLGFSYNGLNGSSWNILSDQRIKENIIKADLKTCYNNVKNINLYRYNFIDAFDSGFIDKNKLGYIAQEVKRYFPKATHRGKKRLNDNREIPDLLTIDVDQINLTLYGAVKQLIKVVEKQNKRIKALETLLNIEDNDDVEDDAGQPYERIYDEDEIDIDTIEPTEPPKEV